MAQPPVVTCATGICHLLQVLVNFGSSWCHHCHQMFPHFLSLSKQFPQLKYAVAQVGAACCWRHWNWLWHACIWCCCGAGQAAARHLGASHSGACTTTTLQAELMPGIVPTLQVDYMHDETRGITYTPTFAVYKKGRKVGLGGAGQGWNRGLVSQAIAPHALWDRQLLQTYAAFRARGMPRLTIAPGACNFPTCGSPPDVPGRAAQVDQFFGANEQQLRDHMWLWTRQTGSQDGST